MDGFTVLAEPTRRRILDALRPDVDTGRTHGSSGADVGTLVAVLALPQPTVSKHLRVLRDAGAVTVRVLGPRRIYALAPQPFAEVASWLEPYQRMWSHSLDALEPHPDDPDAHDDTVLPSP